LINEEIQIEETRWWNNK